MIQTEEANDIGPQAAARTIVRRALSNVGLEILMSTGVAASRTIVPEPLL